MSDDGLAGFLRARLDEDEAVARGAARTDDGHGGRWAPVYFGSGGFDARVDDHIARHDPARVLREVVFWQKVLDAYSGSAEGSIVRDAIGFTVTAYASVWSDHPDYRPEWGP